jgi:hypothetical protein
MGLSGFVLLGDWLGLFWICSGFLSVSTLCRSSQGGGAKPTVDGRDAIVELTGTYLQRVGVNCRPAMICSELEKPGVTLESNSVVVAARLGRVAKDAVDTSL